MPDEKTVELRGSSVAMTEAINKIKKDSISGMRIITAVFNSGGKQNILTVDRFLQKIVIDQDFKNNIYDNIMMYFETTIPDYFILMKAYKNLTCTIIEEKINNDPAVVERAVLSYKTYRVVIAGMEDFFKNVSAQALEDVNGTGQVDQYYSTMIPVTVQLIDPIAYDIRKFKFNMILKNVDMETFLCTFTFMLGIKKIYLIPPDNKNVYMQYPIEPFKTAFDVFKFLQDKEDGGVYNNGLSAYYTEGVMYIYPTTKTKIENSYYVTNIYRIAEDVLMGLDGYMSIEDKVITNIIANGSTTSTNIANIGVEENGTTNLILNNNKIQNDSVINTEETVDINDDNTSIIQTNNNVGILDNTYTPIFKKCDNNTYTLSSKLNCYNFDIQELELMLIPPFTIKPGNLVTYNYDNKDLFTTVSGIPIRATYTIEFVNKTIYKAAVSTCKLVLATDINENNSEE